MNSIHFSGFTLIFSNGTLRGPDGATRGPDGATRGPDGVTKGPAGAFKGPAGAFNEHDGTSKYTTARYIRTLGHNSSLRSFMPCGEEKVFILLLIRFRIWGRGLR
ncbi:MAG TPA: hypothetical protein VHO70_14800 [Chitinispirillaceae bacterium]|nr:hypothetical protein [Chitinispirillaceae bacterium]